MINQGRLSAETIARVAAELTRLSGNRRILWSPLSRTVSKWLSNGAQPFRASCGSML
jgi:hypothetical protein